MLYTYISFLLDRRLHCVQVGENGLECGYVLVSNAWKSCYRRSTVRGLEWINLNLAMYPVRCIVFIFSQTTLSIHQNHNTETPLTMEILRKKKIITKLHHFQFPFYFHFYGLFLCYISHS